MKTTICNFCKRPIDIDKGYYSIGPARHIDPVQATMLYEVSLPQSMKFFETEVIDICLDCWEKFKAAITPLVGDGSLSNISVLVEGGGDNGTDKPN